MLRSLYPFTSIHPSIRSFIQSADSLCVHCFNPVYHADVNVSKGGAEEAKGPVMRCTFDVAKLDCLKRHEEALRKRHEAVKRERHQEGRSIIKYLRYVDR